MNTRHNKDTTSETGRANNKRIWIAWERQLRSVTLSKEFSAKFFIVKSSHRNFFRYIELIIKTTSIIKKENPGYVFAQNPSVVLAALICFLKKRLKFIAIVDRHTNFKLEHRSSRNPKWKAFYCLSNYSLKNADFTIVTNRYLKLLIGSISNNVLVLPDRIPTIKNQASANPKPSYFNYKALFICTFADDEPYREVFEALKSFPEISLEVTGNYKKALGQAEIERLPGNIQLLGFVSDQDYVACLLNCDFTVVLTKQEFTLNCGAYESLAAGKPMLISDTKTIRSYFTFGANYAKNDSTDSIRSELKSLSEKLEDKEEEISDQLPKMQEFWKHSFILANKKIINSPVARAFQSK